MAAGVLGGWRRLLTLLSTGFSKRRPRALKTQKAELHATAANLRASCMPKVSAEKGGNVGADGRGAIRSDAQVPSTSRTVPFCVQTPEIWLTALRTSGAFAPRAKRPSDLLPPQSPGATPGVRAPGPQKTLELGGEVWGSKCPQDQGD